MSKLTEQDLKKIFANPFYCINISEDLTVEHEPLISKEDWVKTNVKLVEEIGVERWLHTLLDVLEGGYVQ